MYTQKFFIVLLERQIPLMHSMLHSLVYQSVLKNEIFVAF